MPDYFAHPTSVVDEGATIGANTKIWHFCHISAGSEIGADCTLGQNVFVAKGVHIGRNVKVQNNVSIYEGVTLEDDVFCGPSMVFTNVMHPRAFVSRKDEYLSTRVKRGATIGANATIVCGVTIGQYAFIGAGAVVTREVADYALVYGNPARQHGWVCKCGEQIAPGADNKAACARCKARYELADGALRPARRDGK